MINLKDISFRYRAPLPEVLSSVSLDIKPGEKVLIAGKNGAGKTTLSRILSGLIPHVEHGKLSGAYFFDGKDTASIRYRDMSAKIALLFQDFESQIVSTSVREELLFYPLNLGRPYAECEAPAEAAAVRFGISGLLKRDVSTLSGGERQKTALASLFTSAPGVLILDEPFTDIDPLSQGHILGLLRDYKGTLIVMDQSLDFYDAFDRIILLKDGRIIYDAGREAAAEPQAVRAAGLGMPAVFAACGCFSAGIKEAADAVRRTRAFDGSAWRAAQARQPAGEPVVAIKGLSYSYPGAATEALRNVDLTVNKGEFISVLGKNGSGKTTLMKIIAGIHRHKKGEVLLYGKNAKDRPMDGSVGYVYQNPDNQIFAESVREEVGFGLKQKRLPAGQAEEKTGAMLARFGLAARAGEDPFSLPKGDREKVACASILVMEPDIIILDEPTTGLDHPSLKALMDVMKGLNASGSTIIMITHHMEAAALYSRRVVAMADGGVVFDGPCREFFADDNALAAACVRRTGLMDLSLSLNGKLILNMDEFDACWPAKGAV